jgi:hypothetical protein
MVPDPSEAFFMPIDRVNWLAVIVGGLVFFFWGFLWYGLLFAHQWAELEGKAPSSAAGMPMMPTIVSAVVALVLSFGVAVALSHDDDRTAAHGAQFGIFFGLIFFASIMLQQSVYEERPLMLWAINAGYVLLGLVILGLIHGAWKKRAAAS